MVEINNYFEGRGILVGGHMLFNNFQKFYQGGHMIFTCKRDQLWHTFLMQTFVLKTKQKSKH